MRKIPNAWNRKPKGITFERRCIEQTDEAFAHKAAAGGTSITIGPGAPLNYENSGANFGRFAEGMVGGARGTGGFEQPWCFAPRNQAYRIRCDHVGR